MLSYLKILCFWNPIAKIYTLNFQLLPRKGNQGHTKGFTRSVSSWSLIHQVLLRSYKYEYSVKNTTSRFFYREITFEIQFAQFQPNFCQTYSLIQFLSLWIIEQLLRLVKELKVDYVRKAYYFIIISLLVCFGSCPLPPHIVKRCVT